MQLTRLQRLTIGALVLMAVGACSNSTAPLNSALSGDYEVDAVNGVALPVEGAEAFGSHIFLSTLRITISTTDSTRYTSFERDSVVPVTATIPAFRIDTVRGKGAVEFTGTDVQLRGLGIGGHVLSANEFTQRGLIGVLHFRRAK